ncbi:metal-dependent hydrolase [Nocardioides sp. Root190]|uniref:metal-dependent hydrolase n=1 Tax=Nocardioides sp. Root190 TaxID=1736488 RepID=UPI0006F818B1|nr:metal-dependent hydrolase [Nocardioides sp. Root190]KRB76477.1 metal-dependent hydrolase [Nocardioides sp. Root190]
MSARREALREPEKVALHARDVVFDWAGLPLRWIPGEAFASHLVNVMHVLLPEGERWFVKTFTEVLPMIKDERLREEVLGFIGQEGMHASAHQGVADYFDAHGLDTTDMVGEIEHVFNRLLGDRDLTGAQAEEWLVEKVALIAGIEHITAFLGHWILNSPALDEAGADSRMLDLLRWHGAEEVEHRHVAFELYDHLDGRYVRRMRAYGLAVFGIFYLWIRSVRHLIENDPTLEDRDLPVVRSWMSGARRGILPGIGGLVIPILRYAKPTYHPRQEGSTSQAVAYLATSPAALAADGR